LTLFQAGPSTARLYNSITAILNKETTTERSIAIVKAAFLQYWPATLASILLSAVVWHFAGWPAGILFFLLAVPVSIGYWVVHDISHNVVDNDYGLCTGMSTDGSGLDALTPWLHEQIQNA